MAQPTGTFSKHDAVGVREDLIDIIYNVDPDATPFMTGSGRVSAKNTLHEWQTDALDPVDEDNARIEGDDANLQTSNPTTRLNNECQISDKTAVITGTLEAVDKAGRRREMAYQIAKRSRELKRDCETILLKNQAKDPGANNAPRLLAGLPAWLESNTDFNATGGGDPATPGGTAPRSDGTQRALSEDLVKAVSQDLFNNSGTGSSMVLMAGPFNKRQLSSFTGTQTTKYQETKDTRLVDSVDFYTTDFHDFRVVPNRFQRDRDLWLLNMEYTAVAYLRPFRQWPLAKTGDTEKRQILVEYTLKVGNEKALGGVFDLTTS